MNTIILAEGVKITEGFHRVRGVLTNYYRFSGLNRHTKEFKTLSQATRYANKLGYK